jgi:heme-degrading monooxygenase HmoA
MTVTLVVHHRVADYDVWKPVFDEHESVRRSYGEIEHRVYRDIHDRNRVIVHNDFPSEEAARAFMQDPSLKDAMSRGGVEGEPGISIIDKAERKVYDSALVGPPA